MLQRERSEDGKLALIKGLALWYRRKYQALRFMIFRQPKAVTLAAMNAMALRPYRCSHCTLENNSDEEIRRLPGEIFTLKS